MRLLISTGWTAAAEAVALVPATAFADQWSTLTDNATDAILPTTRMSRFAQFRLAPPWCPFTPPQRDKTLRRFSAQAQVLAASPDQSHHTARRPSY
jgi:hypothetical protein